MATKKTSDRVIEILNQVYTSEIGAIGIYMDQHARMDDQGLKKFAERLKGDAVEEMGHAESLMERILYVGGAMKYEKHEVPRVDMADVPSIIKVNIDLEVRAIERLNNGIRMCYEDNDNGTRLLLESILKDEEKHLDEYETLQENVEKYGDAFIVNHLI
ncbi:MAG: ferritin-like domain-containing protein [Nitrospinota bacterium]|nr:ferritin-like domain-containing protein [Nitrospinota bacterium]MDH5756654.1 ferritin-like domain-containing protein [Nitrospinota bacterium]